MEIREKQMPYKYLKNELTKNGIVIDNFARIVMENKYTIKEIEEFTQFKFNSEQTLTFRKMLDNEIKSIYVFDDVKEYLKELNSLNIKTILCSNLALPYGESAKNLILLDKYILSYEVGCIKPDNKIYQICLDCFKLTKKDVLFIGDSIRDDYQGATNFGMNAILIKRK